MKIYALIALITLLSSGSLLAASSPDWGLTADLTYAAKYMIDGFKVGGDYPVVQPSVDLKALTPGLSFMFWSSIQINRSNLTNDELDIFARYHRDWFSGSWYAVHMQTFADYWIYPTPELKHDEFGVPLPKERNQGNKLHFGISFPELLPLFGWYVIPSYNAYYWIYWAQNRKEQYQGGALHQFQLRYAHDIPVLIPGADAQFLGLSTSTNYHAGAFGLHPGWTHVTAQLGTSLHYEQYIFSMSLDKQWTYNPDLNAGNEFWSSLSITRNF